MSELREVKLTDNVDACSGVHRHRQGLVVEKDGRARLYAFSVQCIHMESFLWTIAFRT